VTREN